MPGSASVEQAANKASGLRIFNWGFSFVVLDLVQLFVVTAAKQS